MSSVDSEELQSLHSVASDSGYTSQASTNSLSRKRARSHNSQAVSLTELGHSRSRGEGSLNAKFDRLTSSMNDIASGSSTAEGVGKSLGVERKTIIKKGDKIRGSVKGSVARSDCAEEVGSVWSEQEAAELRRRQRRKMNEAMVGPGSSVGAVGEAFRMLRWDARGTSDAGTGSEGAGRYNGASVTRLEQQQSPSGSGRFRTVARPGVAEAVSPTQLHEVVVPPWQTGNRPDSPPRALSPPPRWLTRIIDPPSASPPAAHRLFHSQSYAEPSPYLAPHQDLSHFPSAASVPPPPFPQATSEHFGSPPRVGELYEPLPYSISGRPHPSPALSSVSARPHSRQRPFFEAQLALGGPSTFAQGTPIMEEEPLWREEGYEDGSSLEGPTPSARDFAEPPSPSPPSAAAFRQAHVQTDQIFPTPSFQHDILAQQRNSFPYPSTSALLSAVDNSWHSPPSCQQSSSALTFADHPALPSFADHEGNEVEVEVNFWRRAPPPRIPSYERTMGQPRQDLYSKALLQNEVALAVVDPQASKAQLKTPFAQSVPTPQVDARLEANLTPRQQPVVLENPPPLSRKSCSSTDRSPLVPASRPRLVETCQPAQTVEDTPRQPPAPTWQRSFPLPDPVQRPSTAPNPPTSPLLPVDDELEVQYEDQENSPVVAKDSEGPESRSRLETISEATSPSASPADLAAGASQTGGELSFHDAEPLPAQASYQGEEEDELESRGTDGDSIFPPTRYDWEEEEAPEGCADLASELGGDGGRGWKVWEDEEDPIESFTQE